MSEEFATFTIAQQGGSLSISTDTSGIHLDYCIPQNFSKKRTDVTGVQSEVDVHPDTGPAGAFVELQITIDRSVSDVTMLSTLIAWYATQNTNSTYKRGFLSLSNTDNPELNLTTATSAAGYKLVQFQQLNPVDFKGRQIFRILLQFSGDASSHGKVQIC